MRALCVVIALLAAACTLDPSTKPDCLEDRHCSRGHCREQVCYANELPVGKPDVIYILNPPTGSTVLKVLADLTKNDIDVDGDPIRVFESSNIFFEDDSQAFTTEQPSGMVEIQVKAALPGTFTYKLNDTISTTTEGTQVTVAKLEDDVTVRLERGTSVSMASALGMILDQSPEALELVTPPTVGTIVGTMPGAMYVPGTDYCGTDSALYRVRAANGDFDIRVTFEVGILIADDQGSVEFGTPTSIDVLANDRAGLELVSTNATYAAPNVGKDRLVVDPPFDKATAYAIEYTARDARGCEGKATLHLTVEYPTRVLIGTGLTGDAFDASLSDDGRYLAFTSADATLVTGDTNGAADVFVLDLATNAVQRVSVATGGAQANESSTSPTISADGRYVAFVSRATNLSAQDTTSVEDIYVRDRTAGTTTLVSVSIDNTGSDGPSLTPHISSSGTRIVFASTGTRLVSGDTNAVMDVFVRDVPATTTQRISVTAAGAQLPYASHTRPRISGNGRYVALSSTSSLDGSNSGGAFLVDTSGSAVSRIDASYGEVDLDDAGRFVIHADYVVTLIDRVVENTTNLMNGTFPSLSGDGRYAAFADGKRVVARGGAAAMNVDCIVDREGKVVQATPLRRPEISGNGRWIVFSTNEWPGHVGRFVIVRVWNRAFTL